ncbi:MAG: tRNA lysidine(34) synthetase TilS [Bdellovibrionales bacterium]
MVKFAIALSGGPDSWALALMAQEQDLDFIALTVDHKLRPESTAEAQQVATECTKRGIKHETLTWQHDGVTSRIQERARNARYELLLDYCKNNDIPALLTAHHADDQAETILMRIAKASGVKGLAGLRPVTEREGITIVRPLLQYTKRQLVDYVIAKGVPFVKDPGNESSRYARGRLRGAVDVLAAEGLTPVTLQKFADKMRDTDAALDEVTAQLVLQHVERTNPCVVQLQAGYLRRVPHIIQQRALVDIWRRVTGGNTYAPGPEALQTVLGNITSKQTCGGMVIEPFENTLRFYRELQAVEGDVTIPARNEAVWDRRFRIINSGAVPVTVGALGDVSTAALEKACPWAAAIRPVAARATLPALGNRPLPLGKDADSGVYAMAQGM